MSKFEKGVDMLFRYGLRRRIEHLEAQIFDERKPAGLRVFRTDVGTRFVVGVAQKNVQGVAAVVAGCYEPLQMRVSVETHRLNMVGEGITPLCCTSVSARIGGTFSRVAGGVLEPDISPDRRANLVRLAENLGYLAGAGAAQDPFQTASLGLSFRELSEDNNHEVGLWHPESADIQSFYQQVYAEGLLSLEMPQPSG